MIPRSKIRYRNLLIGSMAELEELYVDGQIAEQDFDKLACMFQQIERKKSLLTKRNDDFFKLMGM